MDKWDEMRTALQVARLGTVSAASDALGLHRATVIRHIDSLERELGAKLFIRHGRGYTATEVGQDVLRVATATEEQFTHLAGRTRGKSVELTGDLIVTSMEVMSPILLPALEAFHSRHPGTTCHYLVSGEILNLEYGEAHVAVRAGPRPDHPDNVVQRFVTLRTGLYAHPRYVARFGVPKGPSAFAEHLFVGPETFGAKIAFARWMERSVPAERIVFRSSSHQIERQAVRAGMGIGFYPAHEAAAAGLVEVVAPRPVWDVPFWLVTHVDQHRSAKVQALLRVLKDTRARLDQEAALEADQVP